MNDERSIKTDIFEFFSCPLGSFNATPFTAVPIFKIQFKYFPLNAFNHSKTKTIKIQLKFRKRRISSWVSRDPVHRILPSNWIKWNEKLIKSVCCWNSILHTPRSTTYICKWITKIQFKSSRDENHFIYFFKKNPQTWACDERCNSFFSVAPGRSIAWPNEINFA